MLKFFLTAFTLLFFNHSLLAQFEVRVVSKQPIATKDAILFTLMGSKDVVAGKVSQKDNQWVFNVPNIYYGMMRVYFPDINASINLVAENKNVELSFTLIKNKVSSVDYKDETNILMDKVQDIEQKKEYILPALYQIDEYYKTTNTFKQALELEITRINSKISIDPKKNPFISYYNTNYNQFLVKEANKKEVTPDAIAQFIINSNEYLESSSLLRPLLVAFLNSAPKTNVDSFVDELLKKINVETPRGQVVLSELIDVFNAYGMNNLKDKYLTEAKNLKCTISNRLATTINQNKNTEMGAVFPNYIFQNTRNTTSKSLFDMKSKFKIIVFWSSTCSHCETELPKFITIYPELKNKGIEIIGFSLDSDLQNYNTKTAVYPWVNTSELKGYNSSFAETYNIQGTPTFFILDDQNKIVDKPDHVQDVLKYFNFK